MGGGISENALAQRIVNNDMGAKSATALINQEGRKRGLSGKALVSWGSNVLLKADMIVRSPKGQRKRSGGSGSSGG